MTALPRSPLRSALLIVLFASGWAIAAGLAWRAWEEKSHSSSVPTTSENPFARIFHEWASDPKLAGALVAFCLLDEKGQTVFASPLAESALCPASSLKTLTTGAAFGILGSDFRFETTLASTAPLPPDGTCDGDLILIGGGDPTLTQNDLIQLANDAITAGLKAINGRLLVDTSIFPRDPVSEHWNWGDIGNAYGAGAFGVNLEHNRLEARFAPGTVPGTPARFVSGGPTAQDTRWENEVTTGPVGSGDEVVVYSEPYGRTITLRGTVPAGVGTFTVAGAIPDPPALAADRLRAYFESRGVKISGNPGPFASESKTTLARHSSAPLPEIVDHLHKVSDNLEAQSLFLTIGRKQNSAPADAVRQYWEKSGVDFVGLRLIDGNGLARANMIRPLDLARVNRAARHSSSGQRFYESLSVYGQGHVRAKIGGMSGVKTQVGFIQTLQGRELTFAVMGNGLPVGREFWQRLETLLETVRNTEL